MTDSYASSAYQPEFQDSEITFPDPRAPEEVLQLLAQEPPPGEYSVDAF